MTARLFEYLIYLGIIGTTIESADDKRLEDAVRAFKHRSRTTDEQVQIGDRRIVDMRVPSGYSWLLASPVSAVIDMRVSRSGSMQILCSSLYSA